MKLLNRTLLLFGILGLSLSACSLEKRCECLETSDNIIYNAGTCYQASRIDLVESVYVINLPTNPDDPDGNYQYDIAWNDIVSIENFSFVDGLYGKHIITVFKISDTAIKVTFDGTPVDKTATYGYLRILPTAFKAKSERATDSVLYAYIAIGDNSAIIDKP